jgi:hypothetical protein
MQGGQNTKKIVPRPVGAAKYQMLLARTKTRLSVFVAGPFLEPGWHGDDLATKSSSVKLRARLRDHVISSGNDVILGEHNGVAEITTETIPSIGNIAASELALVKDADAIILIPDSPGSFCEAGAWSMIASICQKMLVLPNSVFENEGGYLQSALLPFFRTRHALVEWSDYDDHDAVIEAVDQFLEGIADRKVMESLTRD